MRYYTSQFNALEINCAWYALPRADAIARMLGRAPQSFVFTAKLTHTTTHDIDPQNWRSQVEKYRLGMAPLLQAGRRGRVGV